MTKDYDKMASQSNIDRRAYEVWQCTIRELQRIWGRDYYKKDYEQGVAEGINRPEREVLVDDVARGWADSSVLAKYDYEHREEVFAPKPAKAAHSSHCKALEEKWAKEATGRILSKEENQARLRELMAAMDADAKAKNSKKF
jgi:hypothetical protein